MSTHRRLLTFVWKTGALLPLTVAAGFFSSGLIIFQSWQLSRVIDALFLQQANLMQVLPALRLILGIVLARVVFTFVNDLLAGKLAVTVKTGLREQVLKKIDRLGPVWLRRQKTGEIAAIYLQGVDALDSYFSQFLPQVILAAILPLAILVFVFPLDLLTGIIFLVTAPLIPVFMILIGRMAASVTDRQWKKLSQMSDFLLDSIRGLKTLLLLGRSRQRQQQITEISEQYRITTLNVLKVTFLSAFVLELVATIATAVVAVEIGLRLLYARMEFQQAFFILLVAPEFYLPMRNLSMRYHAGMSGVTAAVSIFKLLDTPEAGSSPSEAHVTEPEEPPEIKSLQIEHVTYRYEGALKPAISDLNFEFRHDRLYALAGENGAGKSTLFHLLMRFLEPSSGWILADGGMIRNWSPENWRKGISWVGQRPVIFNTTLLENVRLFDQAIPPWQVEAALEKAMLGELLRKLPHGLETPMLESGARFSSGERQRLALARAFLKNGALVLLDEPTSHMDAALDNDFLKGLRMLSRGRITIMIAHHVPLLRLADEVLVLDGGRLVEQGEIPALLAKRGYFSRLVEAGEA